MNDKNRGNSGGIQREDFPARKKQQAASFEGLQKTAHRVEQAPARQAEQAQAVRKKLAKEAEKTAAENIAIARREARRAANTAQMPAKTSSFGQGVRAESAAQPGTGTLRRVAGTTEQTARLRRVQSLAFAPRKQVRSAALHAVGDFFYSFGMAGEYALIKVWRAVRNVGAFAGQLLVWLFASVGRWIGGFFRGLARDMLSPFRRFGQRRKKLRRLHERVRSRAAGARDDKQVLRRAGMKTSVLLFVNIFGILLPMAAAGVLLFTVHSITSMDYALAVEVNGKVLGYVSDQSVVEGAKGLLRDRIRLAQGQELSDWQLTPTYTLASVQQFTSTQQLANEILLNSENPDDLVNATGLYINGELYAVTDQGEALRAYLDGLLAEYRALAPEGTTVDFVQNVECEPANSDVFFASSLQDYNVLLARLKSNIAEEQMVVADGAQTLADIALANEITFSILIQRNPAFAGEEEDYVPEAGRSIIVRRAQPFLQVQMTRRVQSVEAIPYSVTEIETSERTKGVRFVIQEGVEGQQEVVDELTYIDGELVSSTRVDELTVVLQQPVEQIVEVGTYDFSDVMPGVPTGAYMFPVPTSTWSSRGKSSYHRGVDINAPTGEPIFACNAGVVTVAGWHYSYGYYVTILHADGITTLYAHCSALLVEAGQQVAQGELIALVGSTGNSSGPHCHLEFLVDGVPVDPYNYVAPPEGYSFGSRA